MGKNEDARLMCTKAKNLFVSYNCSYDILFQEISCKVVFTTQFPNLEVINDILSRIQR